MASLGIVVVAERNSGIYQYTLSMLEAIRFLENWRITLYSTADNHNYDALGYAVRRIRASRKHWASLMIRDLLNLPIPDPFAQEDVVLAPYHSPVLLHTRRPFVYTFHDLQEHYFPKNFSRARRIWRKLLNSRLTKRATHIVCESEHVRRDIVRLLGAPAEKVAVIAAPPVTMSQAALSPALLQAVRTKYGLPDRYLFYPAQFWAHKNHLRLIQAFSRISSQFPDVHLVLTGKRRHEWHKVQNRLRALRLEDRVRHVEYVDQSDLAAVYRCALGLVMPSLFESVSIPVYEAFQCGTPVCASNVVAIPEQVGDAALLFDPYSEESIGKSMSCLLGSEALRTKLARLGRARFEGMTHESYAKQVLALLTAPDQSL